MSRALMQSTQLRVTLSLQLEIDAPAGDEWVKALLWLLAWVAMTLWRMRLRVGRLRYEWVMFRQDVAEAAGFTLKLLSIALVSWAWALGVRR